MNDKYIVYVLKALEERDLLELLAEECSELSQAALKIIRASKQNNNYTPVSEKDARDKMYEEATDVLMILSLLIHRDELMKNVEYSPKWQRWALRLGYQEK